MCACVCACIFLCVCVSALLSRCFLKQVGTGTSFVAVGVECKPTVCKEVLYSACELCEASGVCTHIMDLCQIVVTYLSCACGVCVCVCLCLLDVIITCCLVSSACVCACVCVHMSLCVCVCLPLCLDAFSRLRGREQHLLL